MFLDIAFFIPSDWQETLPKMNCLYDMAVYTKRLTIFAKKIKITHIQ